MTFRARLTILSLLAIAIPLAILGLGVRREITRRLTAQHEARTSALADIVREDLAREAASIAARLEIVITALHTDDAFRLGAVRGDPRHERYVRDWASRAMELAGFAILRVYDDSGRIVSSGHFRNEYGRSDIAMLRGLVAAQASGTHSVLRARHPEGPMLVIVRADTLLLGGARFTVVAGTLADERFIARLARGETHVSLRIAEPPDSPTALAIPYLSDGEEQTGMAFIDITPRADELTLLLRDVDGWITGAFLTAAVAVGLLTLWMATTLSRPLAVLAQAALSVDFAGANVGVISARDDEVGILARRLTGMTRRLRTSAQLLRAAERRATVSDLARQLNHDIRNGLVPIRNVLRHLAQVRDTTPDELPAIYRERQSTLDASIAYLEQLSTRWARLSPSAELRWVDLNAVARDVIAAAEAAGATALRVDLDARLPRVAGDPIALRRVVENLLTNALQSLDGDGRVTVTTQHAGRAARLTIADSGAGMSPAQLSQALAGYYTSKREGIGLGLVVVRRLVGDHGGRLHIESAPGRGTTALVELPLHQMEG